MTQTRACLGCTGSGGSVQTLNWFWMWDEVETFHLNWFWMWDEASEKALRGPSTEQRSE